MSDLRPHTQDLVRLSLAGFLRHGNRRTRVCETKGGTPGLTKIAFSGSGALRVDETGRPLQPHWTTVFGLEQYQVLQGSTPVTPG